MTGEDAVASLCAAGGTRHRAPDPTRPVQVPAGAAPVAWRETEDAHRVAHRYRVLSALLGAGVDAARIQVFHDLENDGAYWVVTLDGARTAVLTDDTEDHVVHVEGPWPFKAVFLGPDGVARTKIDDSIEELTGNLVMWCTEAVGLPDDTH
ncbi:MULTISPECIES: hypothetical protein [unclassified Streptomyces]|uniref:hypothetical protein n=1 Tax=unclassified Streptomyces TaxID=2593676 RepID=UPI002A330F50|nr:hypothetical protein [Streptomyces ossamyceticus]